MTAMTNGEEPGVKVTLSQIYEEVRQISARLDGMPDDVKDHEDRIRTLERTVWRWAGAAAVLGTAGGFGLDKLLSQG